jgi:hypothetical protein
MEAICSSETSVDTQRTTLRYTPEDSTLHNSGFLLGLFFDPEDGGYIFLRNIGCHLADYTALYPRRWYSS